MSEKKIQYHIISATVMIVTAVLFIFEYKNISPLFLRRNCFSYLALFFMVILIHVIKAARLYLALYGSDITFRACLKIYCRVLPASVVIPFKLGEFFRMYCYGQYIENILKGMVIILLDRFMDTAALLTAIILVLAFNGGHMTFFAYMLMVFLMYTLLLYFVFPGVLGFWKGCLLRAKASKSNLSVLRILETLNTVYQEIAGVAKGRGIILYFMSLAAWALEIGSLVTVNGITGTGELSIVVSRYLLSAVGAGQSVQSREFVFVSVVVLVLTGVIIKMEEMLTRRRNDG